MDHWFLNNGESYHVTENLNVLFDVIIIDRSLAGLLNGIQTSSIKFEQARLASYLILYDILFVSHLSCDIVSIVQLIANSKCHVTFPNNVTFLTRSDVQYE